MCLLLRFHKGRRLSCGTDSPFKVKGNSLWATYSSLDSQSLTSLIAVKVSRSCHNSQTKPSEIEKSKTIEVLILKDIKNFFKNFKKCRDDSVVKKVWGQG